MANHLAPIILEKLDKANPPQKIDVTEKLKTQVEESRIVKAKSSINRARTVLSLAWVLPLLIFALAMGIIVRSLDQLMVWSGWSLFTGGIAGGILTWIIMNPVSLLSDAFMPPPAGMPPQAAPVIKGVLVGLLNEASHMLTWQVGIVFIVGLGLLSRSFQNRYSKQTGSTP